MTINHDAESILVNAHAPRDPATDAAAARYLHARGADDLLECLGSEGS